MVSNAKEARKRAPFGRQFVNSAGLDNQLHPETAELTSTSNYDVLSESSSSMKIKLSSSRLITFHRKTLTADEIKTKSNVHIFNPRPVNDIKPNSLLRIRKTIAKVQFSDVLATRDATGYHFFDGQRRRQAAILENAGLNVLFTDQELSKDEILEIIKDVQTSEKYSYRDAGFQFKRELADNEAAIAEDETISKLTLRELAAQYDVSLSYVSRALKAAEIPAEIIELFPCPSALGSSQVTALYEITHKHPLSALLSEQLLDKIAKIHSDKNEGAASVAGLFDVDGQKNSQILKLFEDFDKQSKPKNLSNDKIAEGDDRNRWAKLTTQNRKTKVEVTRLSEQEIEKLKQFLIDLVESKSQ
ncbi:hypothetical protein ACROAH_15255 [Shewanella oncorhynchi]|uniref:hypothetical protein n=1 Tax=Shewanella TaxID=22 RepID=UPI0039B0EF0A